MSPSPAQDPSAQADSDKGKSGGDGGGDEKSSPKPSPPAKSPKGESTDPQQRRRVIEISAEKRRDNTGRSLCKVVGCKKQDQGPRCDGFCMTHYREVARVPWQALPRSDEGDGGDEKSPVKSSKGEESSDLQKEKVRGNGKSGSYHDSGTIVVNLPPGARLGVRMVNGPNGGTIVSAVMPESPVLRAIAHGDRIMMINEMDVSKMKSAGKSCTLIFRTTSLSVCTLLLTPHAEVSAVFQQTTNLPRRVEFWRGSNAASSSSPPENEGARSEKTGKRAAKKLPSSKQGKRAKTDALDPMHLPPPGQARQVVASGESERQAWLLNQLIEQGRQQMVMMVSCLE